MYCVKCGAKLDDGFMFCGHCGAKVIKPDGIQHAASEMKPAEESFDDSNVSESYVENDISLNDNSVSKDAADVISENTPVESCELQEKENLEDEANVSDSDTTCLETSKQKIKQKREKGKHSVGSHIVSVFVSILLMLSLLLTLAVAMARMVLHPRNISGGFLNVNVEKLKVEDVMDRDVLEDAGLKCESEKIVDVIFENIDQENLKDELTEEEFKDIIKSDAFSEYIGNVVGDNLEKIAAGKKSDIITIDDVCDFLQYEDDEIEEIIGYEITDKRIENLRKNLNENFSDIFDELQDVSLKKTIGSGPASVVESVFEDWLLILLIVLDLVLVALIFVIMRSATLGFRYCGIPATVVGVIYTALSAFLVFGGVYAVSSYRVVGDFVTGMVSVSGIGLLLMSILVLIFGILMLIISGILNRSARNN